MNNSSTHKPSIFQLSNKPFLTRSVSEQDEAQNTAGPHQKLIRQTDGRYLLIVREASGFIRRLPVLIFEGGFVV